MPIEIRTARPQDLSAINQLIEAAMQTWQLPERVMRLSLPSYYYDENDLQQMEVKLAFEKQQLIAVMACEAADPDDLPDNTKTLLIHGIYVTPNHHRRGIGRLLFKEAEHYAKKSAYRALLVKAHKTAVGFFVALGMKPLGISDSKKHFDDRFWKRLE